MPLVKNTRTEKVMSVPAHYVGHPVLGKDLVLVEDDVQAAPKKETTQKEQPAPMAKAVESEPKNNIKEDKE